MRSLSFLLRFVPLPFLVSGCGDEPCSPSEGAPAVAVDWSVVEASGLPGSARSTSVVYRVEDPEHRESDREDLGDRVTVETDEWTLEWEGLTASLLTGDDESSDTTVRIMELGLSDYTTMCELSVGRGVAFEWLERSGTIDEQGVTNNFERHARASFTIDLSTLDPPCPAFQTNPAFEEVATLQLSVELRTTAEDVDFYTSRDMCLPGA